MPGRLRPVPTTDASLLQKHASPIWATKLGSSVLQAESLHFSHSRRRSTSSPLGPPPSSALAGLTFAKQASLFLRPRRFLLSLGRCSCPPGCHLPQAAVSIGRLSWFSRALFYIISPSPLFRLCRCRACPLFATPFTVRLRFTHFAERSFDSFYFIPLVAASSISTSLSTYSSSCASIVLFLVGQDQCSKPNQTHPVLPSHLPSSVTLHPPFIPFCFYLEDGLRLAFVPAARRPPWSCL